jgi:aminoglycoside phosphotransferase (APT) family kinase protein
MTDTALAAALGSRLREVYGTPVTISGLRHLTGGASRETWSFTAQVHTGGGADDSTGSASQSQRLILRRDPAGSSGAERMRLEAAVLREAARTGVPVPDVIDDCGSAPEVLGGAFMIMSCVDGEAAPRRILHDAEFDSIRPQLAYEMGTVLARIHAADAERVPGLPDGGDQLDTLYREYLESGAPLPVLEVAFRRLRENWRPPARTTVVHGDFRIGNLLVSPSGISGVLDWELTHRGDPVQDLGWLCTRAWRFGSAQRVGGVGDLDALLRGYADESGITVDSESVDWWQLFGSLHWAIICRQQAGRAGSGHDALELLAVGRRVAECEYDLLVELGLPMPSAPPDPADDDPDLFGEPTAAELLDAVGGFIAELADGASDRDRYRSRVAAHVLRIVARESQTGCAARRELGARLARAGFETESDLALAIRDGSADPVDADIAAAISTAVGLRLAVANPRYAS